MSDIIKDLDKQQLDLDSLEEVSGGARIRVDKPVMPIGTDTNAVRPPIGLPVQPGGDSLNAVGGPIGKPVEPGNLADI